MSKLSDFFRGVDGAASGAPVNTVATLNLPLSQSLYTDPNDGVWLRCGNFISTSLASYPDAIQKSGVSQFRVLNKSIIDVKADVGLPNPDDYEMRDNGEDIYFLYGTEEKILQYTLSTPFDLSTATYTTSASLFASPGSLESLAISSNGQYVYLNGNVAFNPETGGLTKTAKFVLANPWDISTIDNGTSIYQDGVGTEDNTLRYDMTLSPDGDYLMWRDAGRVRVWKTPFTSSYGTQVNSISGEIQGADYTPSGFSGFEVYSFQIKSDGSELIIGGTTTANFVGGSISQYAFIHLDLQTPHDFETATFKDFVLAPDIVRDGPSETITRDLSKYFLRGQMTDFGHGIISGSTNFLVGSFENSIGIPKDIYNPSLFLKIK